MALKNSAEFQLFVITAIALHLSLSIALNLTNSD
jgi:hypothetical protein